METTETTTVLYNDVIVSPLHDGLSVPNTYTYTFAAYIDKSQHTCSY